MTRKHELPFGIGGKGYVGPDWALEKWMQTENHLGAEDVVAAAFTPVVHHIFMIIAGRGQLDP